MNPKHVARAKAMALASTGKFRLGAVLAKGTQVLGQGMNNDRTHPRMQRFNPNKSYTPGLHAEVHACMGLPDETLEGADLYVVRVTKKGKMAMAMPCEICRKFIRESKIKRVFFSNRYGQMERL